jgi:flagellar protein FlgJ
MNMMLKSMREATPQDSPMDNEQSRTFTSMLDQQLSSNLSSKGLGLADVLTRQLSKLSNSATNNMDQAISGDSATVESKNSLLNNSYIPTILKGADQKSISNSANPAAESHGVNSASHSSADFQRRMSQHAEEASRATGMPAHLMLGQAALESGWGKREIKAQDGTASHNLFGIKATADWKGKVTETTTTEYINGVKQKRVEKFRAYDSYADSFKDFANLIQNNPRYKQVMAKIGRAHV